MSVVKEILSWSRSCPDWQRDALRRLVQGGTLSANDLAELKVICQAAHNLSPPSASALAGQPLSEEHLSQDPIQNQSVTLTTIEDAKNVNAIASQQPLTFGATGLTILYGDNASGKSGYARVLKSACRARSRPKRILSDVF